MAKASKRKLIGCVGHDCARCKAVKAHASTVAKYLELGDQRLLASDGPVGGQLPDLSPEEWGRVYRACKNIISLLKDCP